MSNLLGETSSRFLPFEAFKERYTVKANFLQYHSVVTAVLNAKKNFVFNQTSNTEQLVGSKNFCKLAYNIHIERQASLPQRNQDKWISDFQAYALEEIDWSKTYSLPFLCTRESKLRVFQFKINSSPNLHKQIPLQTWTLIKWAVLLLWKYIGIPLTSLLGMSKNQSILERSHKMVRSLFLSLDKTFLPSVMFGFCGWHYSPPPSSRPPNCQISHFLG